MSEQGEPNEGAPEIGSVKVYLEKPGNLMQADSRRFIGDLDWQNDKGDRMRLGDKFIKFGYKFQGHEEGSYVEPKEYKDPLDYSLQDFRDFFQAANIAWNWAEEKGWKGLDGFKKQVSEAAERVSEALIEEIANWHCDTDKASVEFAMLTGRLYEQLRIEPHLRGAQEITASWSEFNGAYQIQDVLKYIKDRRDEIITSISQELEPILTGLGLCGEGVDDSDITGWLKYS